MGTSQRLTPVIVSFLAMTVAANMALASRAKALENTEGPMPPWNEALDTESLDGMEKAANAFWRRGFYGPAEAIIQRVFEQRQNKLGADDAEMAYYHNQLGCSRPSKASCRAKRTIFAPSRSPKNTGVPPSGPRGSVEQLSGTYRAQARFAEAELLYRRCITIWEEHSSSAHPDVAVALNNLGGLHALQGEYELAATLFQRALRIQEKSLGIESAEIAASVNNLAWIYNKQGELAKAEALYQRIVKIGVEIHGPVHPDIAIGLNNLGTVYSSQRDPVRAETSFGSLAIREKLFGAQHPDVA